MDHELSFVCPLPPSSNKLYKPVIQEVNGRQIATILKTAEARKYETAFTQTVLEDPRNVDLLKLSDDFKRIDAHYAVTALFWLPRLLKKDPGPKRRAKWTSIYRREDVQNFIKLFSDCLEDLLGIDDSNFFPWRLDKKEDASDPRVEVHIQLLPEAENPVTQEDYEAFEPKRSDPHSSATRIADLIRGNRP